MKRRLFVFSVTLLLLTVAVVPFFSLTHEVMADGWDDVELTIHSPQNTTYNTNDVFLNFSWKEYLNPGGYHIGYKIDEEYHFNAGHTNVSGSYTTFLYNLSEGSHHLTIYVSGSFPGLTYQVDFTVDTSNQDDSSFDIKVHSPIRNQIYKTNDVILNFSWSKNEGEQPWQVAYYLDYNLRSGIGWTNISGSYTEVMQDLSEGYHQLAVFAGHIMPALVIEAPFYVDTGLSLEVTLSSPTNTTYPTEPQLQFTVDKTASWMGYSLDGQNNVTLTETTSSLPQITDGSHTITVYAKDNNGKTSSSQTITFTLDTPPTVTVLTPKNQTYNTHKITLDFTVNEQAPTIAYSLDGQENVTINQNTTLTDLPDGTHTITVYATDQNGNTGTSKTIQFTINTTDHTLTITTAIIATTAITITITVFLKRKK